MDSHLKTLTIDAAADIVIKYAKEKKIVDQLNHYKGYDGNDYTFPMYRTIGYLEEELKYDFVSSKSRCICHVGRNIFVNFHGYGDLNRKECMLICAALVLSRLIGTDYGNNWSDKIDRLKSYVKEMEGSHD